MNGMDTMFEDTDSRLSIGEIDRALQTAHLLRLSEHGHARDRFGDLAQARDPAGRKLDAYCSGVLTALVYGKEGYKEVVGVLIYALVVSYLGPGLNAIARAARMLRAESDPQTRPFFTLGFCTVERMIGGEPTCPGEFARLLARS